MTWYEGLIITAFMIWCLIAVCFFGTAVESLTTKIETLQTDLAILEEKYDALHLAGLKASERIQDNRERTKKNKNDLYEMFADYWSEGSELDERYIRKGVKK